MLASNSTILEKKYLKLLLQISRTEISYCIFDTLKNEITILDHYFLPKEANPSTIENLIITYIKSTPALQSQFDDVLVIHQNNLVTFVPLAFFNENELAKYLQFTVKTFATDYIAFDSIENYEMNTVYIPFVNLNNLLIDIYGNFNYKHSHSILVKKALDLCKNIDETHFFVHCSDDNFQLIVIKQQKLLFYNSFEYKTKEDFIYYLLFTAEQLQLNPESFQLYLLGSISKESELYQITYKYIRNVAFLAENNNLAPTLSQNNYLKNFILIHACE